MQSAAGFVGLPARFPGRAGSLQAAKNNVAKTANPKDDDGRIGKERSVTPRVAAEIAPEEQGHSVVRVP